MEFVFQLQAQEMFLIDQASHKQIKKSAHGRQKYDMKYDNVNLVNFYEWTGQGGR